jgi:hypothetical protein
MLACADSAILKTNFKLSRLDDRRGCFPFNKVSLRRRVSRRYTLRGLP